MSWIFQYFENIKQLVASADLFQQEIYMEYNMDPAAIVWCKYSFRRKPAARLFVTNLLWNYVKAIQVVIHNCWSQHEITIDPDTFLLHILIVQKQTVNVG